LNQAGLIESLENVARRVDHAYSQYIMQNLFLTGGTTLLKNICPRLEMEIRKLMAVDTKISVVRAHDPVLDAWKGAALFANSSERFRESCITRADYDEMGNDYMIEHRLGNMHISATDRDQAKATRPRKRRR
jgi:actin-related protein 5